MALKEIITVLILILSHLILSRPISLTLEIKTKEKKKSGFNTYTPLNYLNFIFYSAVHPSSVYFILFCFIAFGSIYNMSTLLITGLAYPAHIQLHLALPIYFFCYFYLI